MAIGLRFGLIVLMVSYATVLTSVEANRGWFGGWGTNNFQWWRRHRYHNITQAARQIDVGGPEGWHYGFKYEEWAFKNAPFYVNDVLVFKYDPPAPFQHSVYLLPDLWSYLTCDLSGAKMLANVSEGRGDGFKFRLSQWRPHYFACGERGGIHCNNGTMKFFVMPMFRHWN